MLGSVTQIDIGIDTERSQQSCSRVNTTTQLGSYFAPTKDEVNTDWDTHILKGFKHLMFFLKELNKEPFLLCQDDEIKRN